MVCVSRRQGLRKEKDQAQLSVSRQSQALDLHLMILAIFLDFSALRVCYNFNIVYDTVTLRRIFVSLVETSLPSLPLAKHSLGSLKWYWEGLSGINTTRRLLYLLCLGLGMPQLLVLHCHIMAFISLTAAFFYCFGNGTFYFMSQMSQFKLGVTNICPLCLPSFLDKFSSPICLKSFSRMFFCFLGVHAPP